MKWYTVIVDGAKFLETTICSEAQTVAEEYVYGMGGTSFLMTYEDGDLKSVIRYESEGYIDEFTEVEVVKTQIM